MAPGDLGQDLLVVEDSCLLADLEGRELAEVDNSGLEQEESLIQAEECLIQADESCLQMVGSCWKLVELNCHGLVEGMVGKEGRLVLVGHLDVVVGRLRVVEDKE